MGEAFAGVSTGFGSASQVANLGLKTVAHGFVGGTAAVAAGGELQHGFLAAAAAQASAPFIEGIGGQDFGGVVARVSVAATVGGTVSKLSGGSFGNGAVTGAFSRLFNHELHRKTKANRAGSVGKKKVGRINQLRRQTRWARAKAIWWGNIYRSLDRTPASAAIEGAGELFVDATITLGGSGKANNFAGGMAEKGIYVSWSFRDLDNTYFDAGDFSTIGFGGGLFDTGVSLNAGLYEGVDISGRAGSVAAGVGNYGGSVILDGGGNITGATVGFGRSLFPAGVSGTYFDTTYSSTNSWFD